MSWCTERGVRPSPQVFSRGNVFFSIRQTDQPAWESQYAHAEPLGPAPTMTTSNCWERAETSCRVGTVTD